MPSSGRLSIPVRMTGRRARISRVPSARELNFVITGARRMHALIKQGAATLSF